MTSGAAPGKRPNSFTAAASACAAWISRRHRPLRHGRVHGVALLVVGRADGLGTGRHRRDLPPADRARAGGDPFAYLKDVLERLPTQRVDRLGELLPDAWFAAHPRARRKVACWSGIAAGGSWAPTGPRVTLQ